MSVILQWHLGEHRVSCPIRAASLYSLRFSVLPQFSVSMSLADKIANMVTTIEHRKNAMAEKLYASSRFYFFLITPITPIPPTISSSSPNTKPIVFPAE